MDEFLMNKITEEYDVIEDIVAQEVDVHIEDVESEISAEETVYEIPMDVQENVVIDISESIGWVSGDKRYHDSLLGVDAPNQHPITAITNLREELDEIEALKTVQSDKFNVANYYEWKDAAYDGFGYFVSIIPESSKIDLCDGTDIFGVSVDAAGFVGGQDATVSRTTLYGLVVTDGLVDVRCELDVNVGDYVISNTRGYAKKSNSNYGYKVLSKEVKNGIEYAVIMLGVQADVVSALGEDLTRAKNAISANEQNIVAAINVANQAYNKSIEVSESASVSEEAVKKALESVLNTETKVEDIERALESTSSVAAQAKAIAQSAATSAESMKNEAVEKANDALAKTSELREEFEEKVVEIDTELDNAVLELQETKAGFEETINDLKLDTEGQLAGFKKEVSENYATTTQFAAVKTETLDAIAVVKQEASETYATIESVAALQTETSDAIAGFKQEVTDTYATQEMLTAYKNDTSEALSLYKTEVAENYATQEMVSALETDTAQALTDYKQEVTDTYATQEMVANLETDTGKALADYKQEVGNTYATQTSLTELRTDTTDAISASEEKATATYASKNDLTSFESETNIAMARIEQKADANGAYIQSTVSNMDKYSVGPYSQAYGFTLEQATSVLEDGMIYVPTENKHGDDAESYSYVDGDGKQQVYTREFTLGYLYKWGKIGDRYGWITIDKNFSETTETNASSQAVYFTTIEPVVGGNFGYWYTNGDTITSTSGTYEPYTLYKWYDGFWIAVATLAGNSQNRAVSQIRQDANSIVFEVTDVKGDIAKVEARVGEFETEAASLTAWRRGDSSEETSESIIKQTSNDNGASITISAYQRDESGLVEKEASLVLNSNEDGSALCVSADNINFTARDYSVVAENITLDASQITLNGETTFTTQDEVDGVTKINGANIATGTIDACQIDTTGLHAEYIEVKDDNDNVIFKADSQNNEVFATNLAAISANLGTVTSGEIRSSDYDKISIWNKSSEGLTYTLSDDQKYYTISGIGSCTDVDITISDTYKSLPIKSIGYSAFEGYDSLVSITIPASVTSVDGRAFYGCSCLTSVIFGENSKLTSIGNAAFSDCTSLTSVTIPASVTSIGNAAFSDCSSLTSITIPDSVTSIGYDAFSSCTSLMSITVPDGVESIGNWVFYNCSSLTSITIPASVTSIGQESFFGCNRLTSVYYKGTSSDWSNIKINLYNDQLKNATRYYYSETESTDAGNYWHYQTSGFKISCNNTNMIDSRYFKVDQNGKIYAYAGEIGGFKISDTGYISYGKTSYSETTNDGVYLGTDGIGLGKDKFYVRSDGYLYASNAHIGGKLTAEQDSKIGNFTVRADGGLEIKTDTGYIGDRSYIDLVHTDTDLNRSYYTHIKSGWLSLYETTSRGCVTIGTNKGEGYLLLAKDTNGQNGLYITRYGVWKNNGQWQSEDNCACTWDKLIALCETL